MSNNLAACLPNTKLSLSKNSKALKFATQLIILEQSNQPIVRNFISQTLATMKRIAKFILLVLLTNNVSCQEEVPSAIDEKQENNGATAFVPDGFELTLKDDFTFFNPANWSKGLTHDTDPSIKMIWNKNTGGAHLLNDKYDGYILDANTYIKNNCLYLDNRKENIQGTDPKRAFNYSTGWINSLQKINFNGTQKSIYLQIRAKFPKGEKAWPAIWLIDDSEKRAWPPEIDIWEYFGTFFNPDWGRDKMYMRFIYGHWSDTKNHSVSIDNFQSDYKASEEWHDYGYLWTSDKMEWYIDGKKVHTKTRGKEVPTSDWPNKTMCLVINNGLMSAIEEGTTQFPNALILDFLALYEAP